MTGLSARGLSRVAVGLSAASFAISMSGVSPAEAVRAVKRALNAEAVDGISASRTPRAGHLLPLGADGRFPAGVLPAVGRGPRGAQGPPGPVGAAGSPGLPGLGDIRVAKRTALTLPRQASVSADVTRIDGLPAGNWLLLFTASASDLDGAVLTTVTCEFVVAGVAQPGGGGGVGGDAAATHALTLAGTATASQSSSFDVVLRCNQNHDLTASTFDLNLGPVRLVAIRADSLQVTN